MSGSKELYAMTSNDVPLYWSPILPSGSGPWPAVAILHAGGFKAGARGPINVAQDLAAAGFLALACDYRLAPPGHIVGQQAASDNGRFPEQTADVQAAIRAAREDLRCDGRVYVVGGSAGGSHAAYMATTGEQDDDQPDLAVCLSGVYDFANVAHLNTACIVDNETCFWKGVTNYCGCLKTDLTTLAAAAPITHITASTGPLFLLTSTSEASDLDIYDFVTMKSALDGAGIIESTSATAVASTYKQWTVTVPNDGQIYHAFDYWPQSKATIIAYLQGGAPA